MSLYDVTDPVVLSAEAAVAAWVACDTSDPKSVAAARAAARKAEADGNLIFVVASLASQVRALTGEVEPLRKRSDALAEWELVAELLVELGVTPDTKPSTVRRVASRNHTALTIAQSKLSLMEATP